MKKIAKYLSITICLLALLALTVMAPIDRTPLEKQSFYKKMMDNLTKVKYQNTKGSLSSRWGKVNITPNTAQQLAGYRIRPNFEAVQDSLYCHILVLKTGHLVSFIINIDLLIFPPIWKKMIVDHWTSIYPNDHFLFSATHTHNGVGGWDDSFVGKVILGKYQKEWSEKCVKNILATMEKLRSSTYPATCGYWEADASDYVVNRLQSTGTKDGILRGLKIIRSDSARFILFTYSGHATSISKKSNSVSADYPARIIRELHKHNYDSQFLSGMVGSDAISSMKLTDFMFMDSIGKIMCNKIISVSPVEYMDTVSFTTAHIPIEFGPSQLRLLKNWKLRNWLFSLYFRPLQGRFSFLQVNDIIFLGTPCDFSAEIFFQKQFDKWARTNKKKLIVTSFNGDYVGYILHDRHYDQKRIEEVYALNWVGPYFGEYFAEAITQIVTTTNAHEGRVED